MIKFKLNKPFQRLLVVYPTHLEPKKLSQLIVFLGEVDMLIQATILFKTY